MNRFNQRVPAIGENFRTSDRLEILDLTWRFAAAMDMGDLDMFEQCFAERLTWDLSRNPVKWTGGPADDAETVLPRSEFMEIVRGRDFAKLARPARGHEVRKHFAQHGILNPIVTFTGQETATLLGYNHERVHEWLIDTPGEEEVEWMDMGGWYHLDFLKSQDRWRISALRLEIVFFDPKVLYSQRYPRRRAD
jgi:hypothetical protein